jgi:hypothetical protein
MAGQAQATRLQPPTMASFVPLLHNACKHDVRHHLNTMPATWSGSTTNNVSATGAMAAATFGSTSNSNAAPSGATDMASYLQQLQDIAAAKSSGGGGAARGEQCPRCASHDTKFCYYNTSQPRHFYRACRRYWTLGGSLRNVPIGGSTRKRPRLVHPQQHARRATAARRHRR